MKTSGAIFTFLGGAMVGAGVAMLIAPASGEETREKLRKLARAQKDRLSRFPEALAEAKGAFLDTFASESSSIADAFDDDAIGIPKQH
jgi:gas vesicle protein